MSENSDSHLAAVTGDNTEETETRDKPAIARLKKAQLPPDPKILARIIELLSDKNVRISKVAETVLRDPVIAFEVLSLANSPAYTAGGNGISSIPTAIIRIGSEELISVLNNLSEKAYDCEPMMVPEFSALRKLGQQTSAIAEILSVHLQRDIIEVAQATALLAYYDQILALGVLKESYLEVSHISKKSTLLYKLQSQYGFNASQSFLEYFSLRGLPKEMRYAYDKELKCKTTPQASLRFIVESAIELTEAIQEDKFQRYLTLDRLPSKSSLRLLKISDYMYELIVEELKELISPEKKQEELEAQTAEETEITEIVPEADIKIDPKPASGEVVVSRRAPTIVMERSALVDYFTQTGSTVFIEKADEDIEAEIADLSQPAVKAVSIMQKAVDQAKTLQDAINDSIEVLAELGPFTRAAVIELAEGRKEAYIHTAVGGSFSSLPRFERIDIKDPLCPLSTFSTRLQSFNGKNDKNPTSPFGISSYAISPLKGDFPSPIVLYADCGTEKPLPFEARKVFRLVVAILNSKLPEILANENAA